MSKSIEITGVKEIEKKLSKIAGDFNNQKTMNRLGLQAIRYIKKRTRQGVDLSGASFGSYSAAHAKRREKLNLPTDHVDLQMNDIDGMLASLTFEVEPDFSKVHVFAKGRRKSGKRRIRNMDLVKWLSQDGVGESGRTFDFWGLTDDENKKLVNIAKQDLKALIIQDLK